MLITLARRALSFLLSGRFMWVDLRLEASSETAGMNVIQWQQSSSRRKVFVGGACAHRRRFSAHRTDYRPRVTSVPQPFCREIIAGRAASDTAR